MHILNQTSLYMCIPLLSVCQVFKTFLKRNVGEHFRLHSGEHARWGLHRCFLAKYKDKIPLNKLFRYPPQYGYFGWTNLKKWLFFQNKVRLGFKILHGLLSHKNIRIPIKKIIGDPPSPPHYAIFVRTKGVFSKNCPRVPKLGMKP